MNDDWDGGDWAEFFQPPSGEKNSEVSETDGEEVDERYIAKKTYLFDTFTAASIYAK